METRCPFAVYRPIRENYTQPRIVPTQVIFHSAVDAPGPSSLFNFFNSTAVDVETHMFIKNDGLTEQYLDLDVRADANRWANVRAISVETEDEGDPNNRRWTPQQVASIKRLLRWLWSTSAIPPRMCPAWDKPGVGYHTMWGAPSPWTPVSKTCPGTVRKLQWAQEIEPWIRQYALARDTDMTPAQAKQLQQVADQCQRIELRVIALGQQHDRMDVQMKALQKDVDAIQADMGAT